MDRRIVEHFDQRDSRAEPVLQFAVQPRQQQGIAAQVEDVVVNADLLNAEDVLPDFGDLLFDVASRRLTPADVRPGPVVPPLQFGKVLQEGPILTCGEPPTEFPALQLTDRRLRDCLLRNGQQKIGPHSNLANQTLLNLTQHFGKPPIILHLGVEKDGKFLPIRPGAVNGKGRSEALFDVWHGVHKLFDFATAVVHTPNDDAVLRPPGDDQLVVGEKTHVSRFEPTVGVKDAVGLGIAEVSR